MKTLIEDLKKVLTSDIEDKDKYCEKLINGFLREREIEQAPELLFALQDLVRYCEENENGAELELAHSVINKALCT